MQLPGSCSRALRSRQPRARRGDHEEGRRGEGKGGEGGEGRSRSLAPPSLGPVPQPDRPPGTRPRCCRRRRGHRAPGKEAAMGAAPEPSPAQPAPPRDGAARVGPAEPVRVPGVPPRGDSSAYRGSAGTELAAPMQFVPELNQTGLKSLIRALGRSTGSSRAPRGCCSAGEALGAAPNRAGHGHRAALAPRPRLPLEIVLWLFLALEWF